MVCEKVGATVKALQIHKIISVFDLKRRGSDRSVFDIKVPRECVYGTFMLYTDRSVHANKAKTEISYRNPGLDASGINGTYGHHTQHMLLTVRNMARTYLLTLIRVLVEY